MKKIIATFLSVALCFSMLFVTGCDTAESDRENAVKNDIYAFYEDIKVMMDESSSKEDFINILAEYCNEKKIDNIITGDENLLIEVKAAEGYENQPSSLIVGEYSLDRIKESSQILSIGMATVKNVFNNGALKFVITPETDSGSFTETLDKKYLEADNVIGLTDWHKTELFFSGAGTSVYTMDKDITPVSPSGNLAYKIKISGINENGDDSGNRSLSHKNPITILTDMFSSVRSGGTNIEVAFFESTSEIGSYVNGAEATVVIDKSSKTKFETKLESTKENFLDDVFEKDENASFEYETTELPEKVLSYNDTAEFLSLMYTLVDGVFSTSEPDYEGDVTGVSTLYSVAVDNHVQVKVMCRYISEEVDKNMDTTFEATAQLSDFNLNKDERCKLWSPDTESEIYTDSGLKQELEKLDIDRKMKYLLKEYPMSELAEYNGENCIIMGVNIDESLAAAMALINYSNLEKTE